MCRPVPVLAEASVIFAGLVRAPFARFLAMTALSNLGIAVGYAAFGAFSMRVDSFLIAFLGALMIPGLAMLLARLTFGKRRMTARQASAGHAPSTLPTSSRHAASSSLNTRSRRFAMPSAPTAVVRAESARQSILEARWLSRRA